MLLRGTQRNTTTPAPPTLPPEIEKAAAQIEIMAAVQPVFTPLPSVSTGALKKPADAKKPPVKPIAHAKTPPSGPHGTRIAPNNKSSVSQPRHHGS
jgi:hypothetical protein